MAFIILEALRRGKKLDIRKQVLQNQIKVIISLRKASHDRDLYRL